MNDIERLRVELRLPNAPLVNSGLSTVDGYFRRTLHLNPHGWLDYLSAIDFHQRIWTDWLPRGMRLIRYDDTEAHAREKPFTYFTLPGTPQESLGTNYDFVKFGEYEVYHPVFALISTASHVSFGEGRERLRARPGGGIQYIVPSDEAPFRVRTGAR